MKQLSSRSALVLLGLITVYALFLSGGGIRGFFTGDDGGNLSLSQNHGYWSVPFSRLLLSTVSVVTPEYRPVGGLFYRSLYALAGFHPLPFRIACFAIMIANFILTYRLLNRLTNPVTAITAVAFTCYHASFVDLYWSTGTVYDLLCYGFLLLGFLFYLRARERTSRGAWRAFSYSLVAFALAIGSKEMALVLPPILVLFELLRVEPARASIRVRIAWIAVFGALAAASLASKLLADNFLKLGSLYVVHWSGPYIANSYRHYLTLLCYMPRPLTNLECSLLLLGMVAIGSVLRARVYWFGLLFFFAALVPVAVITPRSGFVMYLPLAGLGLSAATATVALAERLPIRAAFVPIAVLTFLLPLHMLARPRFETSVSRYHALTRRFFEQIGQKLPNPGPAPRILLFDDSYAPDDWTLLFLSRLHYDKPRLWLERKRTTDAADRNDLALYDYICTFDGYTLSVRPNDARFDCNGKQVRVEFAPQRVKLGQNYEVTVKEFAGRSIDVAFHLTRNEADFSSGVVRGWCRLDSSGKAVLAAPGAHPEATVNIDVIRESGGVWVPAFGWIEVQGVRYY